MAQIILFAGTTEGRLLAQEADARGIPAIACVATEYGEEVLPPMHSVRVRTGRLTSEEMTALLRKERPAIVFDATHPYAVEASGNIRAACQKAGIRYVRVLREEVEDGDRAAVSADMSSDGMYPNAVYVTNVPEACAYLGTNPGNILLTTGSKELAQFAEGISDISRITARVIPSVPSITLCEEAGLKGRQIVAAQGPFSEESNALLMRERDIRYLVTKESGYAGGFQEKMRAATSCGVIPVVIRRPVETEGIALSEAIRMVDTLGSSCNYISESIDAICGKPDSAETTDSGTTSPVMTDPEIMDPGNESAGIADEPRNMDAAEPADPLARVRLSLIGIGSGSLEDMTHRAVEALAASQVIFGAESVLSSAKEIIEEVSSAEMGASAATQKGVENSPAEGVSLVPVYMPKAVRQYLAEHPAVTSAAVLFSGDSGFYSGAALYPVQGNIERISGISSVQMLSEKTGIGWSDAAVVSLHGRDANLLETVRTHPKTFVLLSGGEQMYEVIKALAEEYPDSVQHSMHFLTGKSVLNPDTGSNRIRMYVGYELGTAQERIVTLCADFNIRELEWIREAGGRFCAFILNERAMKESVLPMLPDTAMIRGKVPMTKADIRHLSVIRLGVSRGAIVWDIGAGTGSVSMEIAGIDSSVQVYAIERNPEALNLIRENRKRLHRHNITVVPGTAPETLMGLPAPDCVFLGGTGGEMREIFDMLATFQNPIRFVLNAVSVETISEYARIAADFHIANEEITQVQISQARKLGSHHLMQAQNPIWIIIGDINKRSNFDG